MSKQIAWPSIDSFDDWGIGDVPKGLTAQAGVSTQYLTGGWRSMRPVWSQDACKTCLLCWVACPDSSIVVADKTMTGIDYDHCKGCGICVNECKFGALELVREDAAHDNAGKGE